MTEKYTREQFWKLYEKLPQELKDALFAEETGDNIYDICKRNGVLEDLDQIVEYVGQVLVGVLPPGEFQETLEKELEVEKGVAKKVTQEINRFIFFPVKNRLEELFKIEIAPPPTRAAPSAEEKPKVPPKKDVYRELVG